MIMLNHFNIEILIILFLNLLLQNYLIIKLMELIKIMVIILQINYYVMVYVLNLYNIIIIIINQLELNNVNYLINY